MLKVWGRRSSLNVQKVLWLLGELDLAYELIPAGGPFGRLSDPDFMRLNPNRLVPVIEDDGAVIWESHSILRYLAATYGRSRFWPERPKDRAAFDRWMDWSLTLWQPAFLAGVFWGYYRTPEPSRDEAAVRASLARCAELMKIVESVLNDSDYIAGPTFTLGDIAFGASLYRYFELDIERPSSPVVAAYYQRLKARPEYAQQVMIPFDDQKGRLTL